MVAQTFGNTDEGCCMVAETFGLSIAVGVSEENNNMNRMPNNTSLYKTIPLYA